MSFADAPFHRDNVRKVAHYCWLTGVQGGSLHAPADWLTDEQCDDLEDGGARITAACGRNFKGMVMPSANQRTSILRCNTCCKRRGMPVGVGSPKNDNGCRTVMGLGDITIPEQRKAT